MYIFIKQHANDGRDDCIYVNRPFFCFLYFFSVLLALVHLNKLVVCKNVHIQSFFFFVLNSQSFINMLSSCIIIKFAFISHDAVWWWLPSMLPLLLLWSNCEPLLYISMRTTTPYGSESAIFAEAACLKEMANIKQMFQFHTWDCWIPTCDNLLLYRHARELIFPVPSPSPQHIVSRNIFVCVTRWFLRMSNDCDRVTTDSVEQSETKQQKHPKNREKVRKSLGPNRRKKNANTFICMLIWMT